MDCVRTLCLSVAATVLQFLAPPTSSIGGLNGLQLYWKVSVCTSVHTEQLPFASPDKELQMTTSELLGNADVGPSGRVEWIKGQLLTQWSTRLADRM